jgi:hypothetical protein
MKVVARFVDLVGYVGITLREFVDLSAGAGASSIG